MGLPAMILWDLIQSMNSAEPTGLDVYQDNQATAKIVLTGKSPALRHVSRTHGINIKWLHEATQGPNIRLKDCLTDAQAADGAEEYQRRGEGEDEADARDEEETRVGEEVQAHLVAVEQHRAPAHL